MQLQVDVSKESKALLTPVPLSLPASFFPSHFPSLSLSFSPFLGMQPILLSKYSTTERILCHSDFKVLAKHLSLKKKQKNSSKEPLKGSPKSRRAPDAVDWPQGDSVGWHCLAVFGGGKNALLVAGSHGLLWRR